MNHHTFFLGSAEDFHPWNPKIRSKRKHPLADPWAMRSPLAKPDLALTGLYRKVMENRQSLNWRMSPRSDAGHMECWQTLHDFVLFKFLSQSDGLICREICRTTVGVYLLRTPWDHYGSAKRRKQNLSPKLQASHIPGNQGDLDSFTT